MAGRFVAGDAWVALHLDDTAIRHGRTKVERGIGKAKPKVHPMVPTGDADKKGRHFGKRLGLTALAGFAGAFAAQAFARVVGKAFEFTKDSVRAASDLNETVNKANVIFGKNSRVVEKWAEGAARSMGLSKQAALEGAASFGDMFQQMGIGQKTSVDMSRSLVEMAADLGSFNNLGTEDVLERISAGFRGEYDSLQKVIPNISAARVQQEALRMTHKKSADDLTSAEKAQAVMNIVMKDGKRAMGDFARTSGQYANQQKIAAANVENLKAKLGSFLLPILIKVTSFFNNSFIPGLMALGAAFSGNGKTSDGFIGKMETLGIILRRVKIWISDNADLLKTLGIAILGVVAVVKVWTTVTRIAAAVQLAWNAVLTANPIGLIIVGLVALGVAVVVAYKKFAGFRSVVNGVWRFLKSVWAWLSNYAWPVIKVIFTAIGRIVGWAWSHIVYPALRAWWTYQKRLWAWIATYAWPVVKAIFTAIGHIVSWAWKNVIHPALRAWWSYFRRVWSWISGTAWPIFKRVINLIADIVRWLWKHIVSPIFGFIRDRIATVFRFIRDKAWPVVRAAFSAFADKLRSVRNVVSAFVGAVVDRFRQFRDKAKAIWTQARDLIGRAWDGIKSKIGKPINVVINTIYTNGIRKLWNTVASKVGLGKLALPSIAPLKWAEGGFVPMHLGRRGKDSVPSLLMPGEGVLTTGEVQAMGGPAGFNHWRRQLRKGKKLEAFGDGGIVGGLKSAGSWLKNKAKSLVQGSLMKVLKPLINTIKSSIKGVGADAGTFGTIARTIASKPLDWILSKIQENDYEPGSGVSWQGPLGGAVSYIIKYMKKSKIPYHVTSALRGKAQPGQGWDYHMTGNAVDFVGPNMTKIAKYWYKVYDALLEEIHSGGGGFFVKKGKKVGKSFYGPDIVRQHFNHVHIAATKNAMKMLLGGRGSNASLEGWMRTAISLAKVPMSWLGPLRTLIMRESGGNPRAINLWDSNAKAGQASRGLMQTIPATFARYRLKSLPNNIYDPVANIVAGLRYIKSRYGSIFRVQQANANASPKGYDMGGWLRPGDVGMNSSRKPEPVFTAEQWDILKANIRGGDGAGTTYVTIHATIPAKDLKEIKDVNAFLDKVERTGRVGIRKEARI